MNYMFCQKGGRAPTTLARRRPRRQRAALSGPGQVAAIYAYGSVGI